MRSNHLVLRTNSHGLFNKIYDAAKAGNGAELKALVDTGARLKLHSGIETPVMLLASQRNTQAVELLLQHAHEEDIEEIKKDAVEGYARGGHIDLVDAALANAINAGRNSTIFAVRAKAVLGYAYRGKVDLMHAPVDLGEVSEQQQAEYHQYIHEGYAKGGHHDLVSAELSRLDFKTDPLSDILQSILKGYALSGQSLMIDKILGSLENHDDLEKEFFDEFVSCAIYYYAVGGWVSLVNDMVGRYRFPVEAMRGYAFGCQLSEFENLLRLLACTTDKSLRLILTGKAFKTSLAKQAYTALDQAQSLILLMNKYSLNYDEVRKFLAQGERGMTWLLQGPQLIADGVLPAELFLLVSSYVLGVSEASVCKIHGALNQQLLEDASNSTQDKWQHRFFSYFRNQNITKRAELEKKSELRGNFYNHP
jgi:hypothetical protein